MLPPGPIKKVVITGALGLLGSKILQSVLCNKPVSQKTQAILLIDVTAPATTSSAAHGVSLCSQDDDSNADPTLTVVRGDIGSPEVKDALMRFVAHDVHDTTGYGLFRKSTLSVFHLASVMSGQGEADFDHTVDVNISGTRSLLQMCRDVGRCPKFVFASSIAAFGGGADKADDSKLLPQTTYGMTKACAELLVNDCTRRGFIDGRIARLPTVIVRPGPPNPAATGCFSSVPKAILHGQKFISPVSADLRHPCISLSSAARGLLRLHDVDESLLGRDRAVTLPSISLTLGELERCSAKLARKLGRHPGTVAYERDAVVEAVVGAMPSAVEVSQRAQELGLLRDAGVEQMLQEYIDNGGLEWQYL